MKHSSINFATHLDLPLNWLQFWWSASHLYRKKTLIFSQPKQASSSDVSRVGRARTEEKWKVIKIVFNDVNVKKNHFFNELNDCFTLLQSCVCYSPKHWIWILILTSFLGVYHAYNIPWRHRVSFSHAGQMYIWN